MDSLSSFLNGYTAKKLGADSFAAVIVTIILVPQSLAYAMLAGLPLSLGLYASMLPLLVYGILGTSSCLAVGPVAITSLMTATAISEFAEAGSEQYVSLAITLALMCGVILVLLGLLKQGWVTQLLSHSVSSGFVTAAGILIILSQLKHLLGIPVDSNNVITFLQGLINKAAEINPIAMSIGGTCLVLIIIIRNWLKVLLEKLSVPSRITALLTKTAPLFIIVFSTLMVAVLNIDHDSLNLVGTIPQNLPTLSVPIIDLAIVGDLLPSALLISLVGYIESISVAQNLAIKRHEKIKPNREFLGLGAANIVSSLSGSYPVMGGFSRTMVNHDAGAKTRLAGVITAALISLVVLFFTPLFYLLPKATLGAIIIVSAWSLIDLNDFKRTFTYSKTDFYTMMITLISVLIIGVAEGLIAGVTASLIIHLWKASRPHIAEVGLVEGTEHFRNVLRHSVTRCESIYSLRVDESLSFINIPYLEDLIFDHIIIHADIRHVVLMCSAINHIDSSALQGLISLNRRLHEVGVRLHLSEVKGPVSDDLSNSSFLNDLTGNVYLSQYDAYCSLKDS